MVKRGLHIVRFFQAVILFCTIALFFGCGSSESVNYSGYSLIGPDGGTVQSSDGKASVSIPAGALASKTAISVRPASDVPAGNIGPAYEFLPGDIDFLVPVTISIVYNESSIPSGLNVSDLCLGVVVNSIWDQITPSAVDAQSHIVSSDVSSFSKLSIMSTGSTPAGVNAFPDRPRLVDSRITLRWNPVMDADSYNIYWSTTPGVSKVSGNKISGVTSPYIHKGRVNDTTYYYIITAVNSFGESVESLETEATPGRVYISGGDAHAAVLKSDGTVWTWGLNTWGQLGNGTMINSTVPVPVIGLTDVIAVAAGRTMTMALKSDGTVWTWGLNNYGELGDGSTVNYGMNGLVMRKEPGQVVGLTDVAAIAAGRSTGIALKKDGTVWAWGENTYGTLGDGNYETSVLSGASAIPVQVIGLTDIVAIATKRSHILALESDGTVWAWGHNRYGQFGNGIATGDPNLPGPLPVQVSELIDPDATIATGYWHSMALKDDGTVLTWGLNEAGELCDGTVINKLIPVEIDGLYDLAAIEGGEYQTIALTRSGTVWMCGSNSIGQLGIGVATEESINTPVAVTGLTDVFAISSGKYYSISLKGDGTIWTWGFNNKGQLGDGTTMDRAAPVQVLMDPLF